MSSALPSALPSVLPSALHHLAPAFLSVERADGLLLTVHDHAAIVDGEGVDLIRKLLGALATRADLATLQARLGDEDPDLIEQTLAWLVGEGFVIAGGNALDGRACDVRGVAAFVDVVKAALKDAGADVVANDLDAAVDVANDAGRVVVACFDTLLDPRLEALDRRVRAAGAALVPVAGGFGGSVVVGPQSVAGGDALQPCVRCTVLRMLARRSITTQQLWFSAHDNNTVPTTPPLDDDAHRQLASLVVRFFRSTDAQGRIDGQFHPVLRLDLQSGLVDAHPVRKHTWCAACATPYLVGVDAPANASNATDDTFAAIADAAAARLSDWRQRVSNDVEGLPPPPDVVTTLRDPIAGILFHGEEWQHRDKYFRHFPLLWGGTAFVREREFITTGLRGINGTGPTLDHRQLVCVSEGIERYAQYSHRPFVVDATARQLGERAFDVQQLALYTPQQYATPRFPRQAFDVDTPLRWTPGVNLVSGAVKLFPDELITVYYTDEAYPNRIIEQTLSSGAASHVSWHRALINCVRELIERDAIMIAWYKKMPLPRLRLPARTGDPYVDDLRAYLEHKGMDVVIYDLRVEFDVPTMLLVGQMRESEGCWEKGGTCLVAVSDPSPLACLSRGLCELSLHHETLCITPSESKNYRNHALDLSDVTANWHTWWPTYMHYLNPATEGALAFLDGRKSGLADVELADLADRSDADPQKTMQNLTALLGKAGLEPWAFDLSADDFADTGFKVCKVVVPGLIDITPGYQSRRLGHRRLDDVAARSGRPCLPRGQENTDPHPNA